MIRASYLNDIKRSLRSRGPMALVNYFVIYLKIRLGILTKKNYTGPLFATLALTYRCNFRCAMCDLPERTAETFGGLSPLSKHDWFNIIQELSDINTPALAISGGEPFLHKDIFEIIKFAKSKKMYVQVTTNGWYLNESTIEKIIDSGLDSVTFSLDGIEEIHNKIRGNKLSYKKILDAMNLLRTKDKRIKIVVNTVLMEENIKSIEKHIQNMKNTPIDHLGFSLVQFYSEMKNEKSSGVSQVNLNDYKKIIEIIQLEKKKTGLIDNSYRYLHESVEYLKHKQLPSKCFAGETTLVIDEFGHYFPCFPYYEGKKSYGNYRDLGVRDFWLHYSGEMKIKTSKCRDCFWNCQVETNYLFN